MLQQNALLQRSNGRCGKHAKQEHTHNCACWPSKSGDNAAALHAWLWMSGLIRYPAVRASLETSPRLCRTSCLCQHARTGIGLVSFCVTTVTCAGDCDQIVVCRLCEVSRNANYRLDHILDAQVNRSQRTAGPQPSRDRLSEGAL